MAYVEVNNIVLIGFWKTNGQVFVRCVFIVFLQLVCSIGFSLSMLEEQRRSFVRTAVPFSVRTVVLYL